MESNEAANDNWRKAIPRPRPLTPRNMIEFANSMTTECKDKLKRKGLLDVDIMRYLDIIQDCKEIKIMALKAMTDEGYKADDRCGSN